MPNAAGALELTREIPTAVPGDLTTPPGPGKDLIFPSGGQWYTMDPAGVVTLLNAQLADGQVTNAKLAAMAAATFKLRAAGAGTGPPIDGSGAQATALLDVATAGLKGLMSTADKTKADGAYFDVVAQGGADPTGTVDATTIISNACATVAAAGGGVVFFPRGTYKVSSTINIPGNFVTLRGVGRVASLLQVTFATGDVFNVTGIFVRFESLRIQGLNSTLRTSGYAINFAAGASNCSAQWVDIIYHWSGVRMTGQLTHLEDMNIREMGANAPNGQIVLIDAFTDQYLKNIVCDNPSNPTGFAGVRITNLSSLIMVDCQIIHCTTGLDVVPTGTNTIPSIYCSNTFFDNGVIGANFAGAVGSTISRCKFTQCWFTTQSSAGIRIDNARCNALDFLGCDIYQSPLGVDALQANDWTVRNSRLAGNTVAAIRTTPGAAHAFTIADNFIGDNQFGFGPNALGINIQAGTYKRYQVVDNRGLESNTTKGITDLGVVSAADQKTVNNNLGALLSGAQELVTSGGAAKTTARGTISVGVAETFLFGARIPANAVSVGHLLRFGLWAQTQGAGLLTWRLRAGPVGTVAAAEPTLVAMPASLAQAANAWQIFEGTATIVALGPTATVAGFGKARAGTAELNQAAGAEVVANVATTADWFVYVTVVCTVSTVTVRGGYIEVV